MHEDHSGAADEGQAFATLLVVSMCFSKENEKLSADPPQVQEDSVEAAQSLPQEGGFDVAEQRADARTPQRGTAMAAFKVPFLWWQRALLNFFNLILSWGVVPTLWKRSIVVPVFKRGDAGLATNYRPISLASCCFKLFEHLVHSRIGPLISSQLDVCQGGFRWGADVLVSSSVHFLMFCHHADLLSHSLLSWISRKRLTQRGLRALWSASMRCG